VGAVIGRIYMAAGAALLAVGLGCAAGRPQVVVEEYPIHDSVQLLGDGPPDSEVLVVRNRGAARQVLVECGSAWQRVAWLVDLPADGEVRGIAQLMGRDVGASTCAVVR
jgi:hypothetical protein